ncbi:SRPBCC domain-containing protein [Nocardiopsis changdeensis]|uniref:SRPBCC domain-containing protein n=1 Tax=Nocardiopsis changdeensis TaxID=2831969 RepID=A0ABX8BRH9_9ACTN|nr:MULTISPECIES: SRPBCC domain-containing protein [Nocardiopsis]QUX24840.1 SRPBCC domain-containing protein [Nocardiopsis changdeensis]QYX35226.1 SRPBCC domain-containing protein [Nocardiopsis sp. MT53]
MTLPTPAVSLESDDSDRTLTLSFPTDASPRAVWSALTDLDSVAAWLAPAADAGGGRYVLTFEHGGRRHDKVFEVVDCVPGHSLSGVLHDPGHPDSLLSAALTEGGFSFVHSDVPEELAEGYRAGWPYYLGRLAAALGSGPAGRAGSPS